jgi:hypothetical protein
MQSLVHTFNTTSPESRFGMKKKSIPTGEIIMNIRIGSLKGLIKNEKFEDEKMQKEWYNLISQYFKLEFIRNLIENEPYKLDIPRPVFVEKDESGNESITYNTNTMELNKLYEIEFQGEKWALRKNEKTVEFLTFYPNKNE